MPKQFGVPALMLGEQTTEYPFMAALAVVAFFAALLAAAAVLARYRTQLAENRRMRALFSRYVPAPVVRELLTREPRSLEAREYAATILVCRIKNFPLFSEELSPEETLHALNEFHALAGATIERRHGIVESLRGDTVVAAFGVLIEQPFQEERALRAALTLVRLASALNERWKAQGRRPFSVSIGIHSGAVVAGDVGYERRREFSVVGNCVQIAWALQGAAEDLNASVVVSEETFCAVRELFIGIPTAPLPLRGLKRLQPARILRGLAAREEMGLRIAADRLRHTVVTRDTDERGSCAQTPEYPVVAAEYVEDDVPAAPAAPAPPPESPFPFFGFAPPSSPVPSPIQLPP